MIEGRGPFRKWGRNPDLDSANAEQVWFTGGTETLPTSDLIDSLVSTDAGDDQTVIIDVMTISGTTLTRVVQEAVVDGTNAYSGFAGHIGKGWYNRVQPQGCGGKLGGFMFEVELYDSLEARLEATKQRITGSKIPAILGLGYKGQNPIQVWLEMTGRDESEKDEKTRWMLDVRSHNEEIVLRRFAGNVPEDRDVVVEWPQGGRQVVLRSASCEDFSVTPDGVLTPSENTGRGMAKGLWLWPTNEGVEAKTYWASRVPDDWENEPSQYAVVQSHWGMAITGWKRWHVPVMFGLGSDYRQYVIERDEAICEELFNRAEVFMEFVRKDVAPDDAWLDASYETGQALRKLYPEVGEGEIEVRVSDLGVKKEQEFAIIDFREGARLIKESEAQQDYVKNLAMSILGREGGKRVTFLDDEGNRVLSFSRSQYTRKPYTVAEAVVDSLRSVKP